MSELPRLAFVHIPKTAGTAVRELLSPLYGEKTFPGMTTLDYACYSDAALADYRFYSGHSYRRDIMRLPPDTTRLVVLRDPTQRAISLYQYYARIEHSTEDAFVREAIDKARKIGIVDFLYSNSPFLIEHLRAGQVRQLIDDELLTELGHRRSLTDSMEKRIWENFLENMESFAFVFTVDWLETSLSVMGREIGVPVRGEALARANVSPPRADFDEMAVRRAVWDISALDCRAYDYARAREIDFLKNNIVTDSQHGNPRPMP